MSGNTKDKIAVRNNAGKTTPAATAPMENAYVNATVLEKIKNLAATFRPRKCNETSSRFLFLSTKVSRGKKEAQQIGYITRRCTSSDYHAEKPYVSRGKKDTQKIGYITRRCTSSDYLAENPRLVAEKRKHIKSVASGQGLQPPEHLSSDLLHYADDPPIHAGPHCYRVQVSKAQPCLAAQYRSTSGMECRSIQG
ncbi:hypothetical protein F2Q70_00002180 [Brassica cretica]|uniref:Uncharacterized protein n=1 Tax=Brassica cretica TaxID=69181 RepID=A0A8S9IRD8_BRACR|nr:hypothetical protein F2Q70_00002180 [Brassica cretica]